MQERSTESVEEVDWEREERIENSELELVIDTAFADCHKHEVVVAAAADKATVVDQSTFAVDFGEFG